MQHTGAGFTPAHTKTRWREAKNKYSNSIFDPADGEDEYDRKKQQQLKKFFGYVKSLKKDASGVAPL